MVLNNIQNTSFGLLVQGEWGGGWGGGGVEGVSLVSLGQLNIRPRVKKTLIMNSASFPRNEGRGIGRREAWRRG